MSVTWKTWRVDSLVLFTAVSKRSPPQLVYQTTKQIVSSSYNWHFDRRCSNAWSATHCLVRSRLRVNYYGKWGRKKYFPLALCARSHRPSLALLTCLQLSRFSCVSFFPLSLRKAWGGCRATQTVTFYCLFWYRLFETNERLKHLPMNLMQEDSLIPMVRLTFLCLCNLIVPLFFSCVLLFWLANTIYIQERNTTFIDRLYL